MLRPYKEEKKDAALKGGATFGKSEEGLKGGVPAGSPAVQKHRESGSQAAALQKAVTKWKREDRLRGQLAKLLAIIRQRRAQRCCAPTERRERWRP